MHRMESMGLPMMAQHQQFDGSMQMNGWGMMQASTPSTPPPLPALPSSYSGAWPGRRGCSSPPPLLPGHAPEYAEDACLRMCSRKHAAACDARLQMPPPSPLAPLRLPALPWLSVPACHAAAGPSEFHAGPHVWTPPGARQVSGSDPTAHLLLPCLLRAARALSVGRPCGFPPVNATDLPGRPWP